MIQFNVKIRNALSVLGVIYISALFLILLSVSSCSPGHGKNDRVLNTQPSSTDSGGGKKGSVKTSPVSSSSPENESKKSPKLQESEKYLKIGDEKLNENKLEEAEKLLTKAIELDPENYDAYDKRSMTYYNMGKHNEGLADCNKAIAIARKGGFFEERCPRGTLARRGAHYFNLNETDKAIEDFREVIKYSPDFAFAYYDLGQSYFKKGEYKTAAEYFNKAIKLNEDERITRSARIYLEKIKGLDARKAQ